MEYGCLERLSAYLRENGIPHDIGEHATRYTAQEVAQVEHVSGLLVAKVVMVKAAESLVMIVVPAAAKVSLRLVGEMLGTAHVRLATEDEFTRVFPDCEVGAMPPLGHLYGLPVVVDTALAKESVLVANAGTHHHVLTMTYDDYARLVHPRVGPVADVREAA